jgi:phage gpG-like protein
MVISITTNYQRKIVKKKMLQSGSLAGLIREQVKRNFAEGGRPRKWKKNTRATIEFKKNHKPRLILKPNEATGEMKSLASAGRIKTVKRKGGLAIKYIVPTAKSRNPIKFLEANKPRTMLPFNNPHASPVRRPERPFLYISREANNKIMMMAARKVEEVVVSMAFPIGQAGNQKMDRVIQDALDNWAWLR